MFNVKNYINSAITKIDEYGKLIFKPEFKLSLEEALDYIEAKGYSIKPSIASKIYEGRVSSSDETVRVYVPFKDGVNLVNLSIGNNIELTENNSYINFTTKEIISRINGGVIVYDNEFRILKYYSDKVVRLLIPSGIIITPSSKLLERIKKMSNSLLRHFLNMNKLPQKKLITYLNTVI